MRFSTTDTVENRPQGSANNPRAILGAMINVHNISQLLAVGLRT
jgi:hypothetical protein